MNFTKTISLLATLSALFAGRIYAEGAKANQPDTTMKSSQDADHYTFTLSDNVIRQKVSFVNRYGILSV